MYLEDKRSNLPMNSGSLFDIINKYEALSVVSSSVLKVHIPKDEDVRDVVNIINNSAQMRSFREVIPSMNDIFIRAVAGEL